MALSGVILSPVASTHFMRTHAATETETEKMKEERWRGYTHTHTLPEVFFLPSQMIRPSSGFSTALANPGS